MTQTHPLLETHPEFTITHHDGFTEYRIEHWRLARDGSGRIVRGTSVVWMDAAMLVLLVFVLTWILTRGDAPLPLPVSRQTHLILCILLVCCFIRTRCIQVLYESLLVFPTLGIQLETHLGHPTLAPFRTVRHFIPLASLEDVIIHEGLRGWNVRYYLAALKRRRGPAGGKGDVRVHVAFENILPHFPVLKVVYLGVQQALFPLPTRFVRED